MELYLFILIIIILVSLLIFLISDEANKNKKMNKILQDVLINQEIASRRMERMERKIDKRNKNNG